MASLTGALKGHHVLITRPEGQAHTLLAGVHALGGLASHIPFLAITPKPAEQALNAVAQQLDRYRAVLFVSANAIQTSWPVLTSKMPWPASLAAASVGPGTARVLRHLGVEQVLMPTERFDSEGLMALPFFSEENCHGQSFALIRGEGGRDFLAHTLRARGAHVDEVASYQRHLNPHAVPALQRLYEQTPPTLAVISSSESLQRVMQAMPEDLAVRFRSSMVLVPHLRIAEAARLLGFEHVMVTAGGDQGILDTLKTYNESQRSLINEPRTDRS